MVITWTTLNETESVVEYNVWGGKLFDLMAKGTSTIFETGGQRRENCTFTGSRCRA
uniref:Uncharacterized protein n=1 Tax=Anguilla anguilla TaxID=7936 RepID=A0A0E9S9H5_ANGAN